MGFAKAQTVLGALYGKDGVPEGTMQVKAGKINKKKGKVKISATATSLVDEKAKKVTAKAAGVKYAKDKATKVASLVVDTKKGTNLSGMKLTYTPKTGVFKGSFKIYAIQGGKLKKFTAKVIGVVIDWKGWGSATGPNGARWGVMVE